MLFDSLENNTFTLIRGKAGSGKSMISLAYLMYKLERHQIDKIIIFCNCVATKDTAKLGFYPGSKDEKLLDSQIGNFLIGKFGGIEGVEDLINRGVLMLVPMADCRGMDIGIRAGVYITEAQNTTVDTMKLVLQRVGEDCICIVEGDDKTQVDLDIYQTKNGLAKASQAFRGEDYYGEVTLKNCYRSKIANRAELMG
jgi:predicted ribonuclease YlaK